MSALDFDLREIRRLEVECDGLIEANTRLRDENGDLRVERDVLRGQVVMLEKHLENHDELISERDELNSYNSHLIADREMLFAENTRLRAALEAIAYWGPVSTDGKPVMPMQDIARRALDKHGNSTKVIGAEE
jgi:hypothetical protein